MAAPHKINENTFGIAGFVLGIASFVLGILFFLSLPLGVLGLIFSIVQLRKSSNAFAIAGIILSILGILFALATISVIAFWFVRYQTPVNLEAEKSIAMIKYDYTYFDDGKIQESSYDGSGVIYSVSNNSIYILTNRHVIDCEYDYSCEKVINETVYVTILGSKLNSVSKIYIAPHKMDLAILEIKNYTGNYTIATISTNITEDDPVIALGYPDFSMNAREFSKTRGVVLGFRTLINDDGFEFEVIDSDALVDFGSSGGGLFDEEGNLIGITTWSNGEESSAISSKSFPDFSSYLTCNNTHYTDDGCEEYFQLNESVSSKSPCVYRAL